MKDKLVFVHTYTQLKSKYGRMAIELSYAVVHVKNGVINNYEVIGELMGINEMDFKVKMVYCNPTKNNEETLLESGVSELLNWN